MKRAPGKSVVRYVDCKTCPVKAKGWAYFEFTTMGILETGSKTCKAECLQAMWREAELIDVTEHEAVALKAAKVNAADYLMKSGLMGLPLASFTAAQVDDFLKSIVGEYLTARAALPDDCPF